MPCAKDAHMTRNKKSEIRRDLHLFPSEISRENLHSSLGIFALCSNSCKRHAKQTLSAYQRCFHLQCIHSWFSPETNMHYLEPLTQFRTVMTEA